MNRSTKVCIAGLIIYALAVTFLLFNIDKSEISSTSISSPNVEEIKQDSTFRDSIYTANDSIYTKIIYIEKEYEENISTIMSNNDSINFLLFSEYIEYYNNQRAAQNNESNIR